VITDALFVFSRNRCLYRTGRPRTRSYVEYRGEPEGTILTISPEAIDHSCKKIVARVDGRPDDT